MKRSVYIFLLMSGLATEPLWASHIAGGDLQMTAIAGSPGRFLVRLNTYFDEINASAMARAGKTNPVSATISKKSGGFITSFSLTYFQSEYLTYTNPACAGSIQVTESGYEATLDLDPKDYTDPAGYLLSVSVRARNNVIVNIAGPGSTGTDFYLEFPPLMQGGVFVPNSSPRFKKANGEFVCLGEAFEIPFTATDPDGDRLVYRMVKPSQANWIAGFSDDAMIQGNPSLSINPATGMLSVTATNVVGLHVIGVEVQEWRNGTMIGRVFREFQLLVRDCPNSEIKDAFVYTPADTTRRALIAEVCPGKKIKLGTQNNLSWNYQWQINGENIDGATNSSYLADKNGKYRVVITMKTQCGSPSKTEEIDLTIKNLKATTTWDSIPVICGTQTLPFRLLALPLGGKFRGKGLLADSITFSPQLAQFGTHQLNYYLNDPETGCEYKGTRYAVVSQVPVVKFGFDKTIQRGDTVTLRPTVALAKRFDWTPPKGLSSTKIANPVASPSETTAYVLRASLENGCFSEANITVNVVGKVEIVNAFTPNGDGLNDIWLIRGLEEYPEAVVEVYNRWGRKVFSSVGYLQPFDGSENGTELPSATYYYTITLPDQSPMKGLLTILK